MRYFRTLVVLMATTLTHAQQLPNLPGCSLRCFLSAMSNDGCETLTDFACHCQKPELVNDVTPCVRTACPDPKDQSSASNAATSQCASAGHPISLPPVGDESTISTSEGTTTTDNSFTTTDTAPMTSETVTLPTSSSNSAESSTTSASSSPVPSPSTPYSSRSSASHSSSHPATSTVFTGGAAPNDKGDLTGAALVIVAACLL